MSRFINLFLQNPLLELFNAADSPETIQILLQAGYMISSVLFILGLKNLSSPATARKGNAMAALAMLFGVIITLLDNQILGFDLMIVGILIGSLVGIVAAKKVEMTSMPELVALFNGFGGIASSLVALGEIAKFYSQTLYASGEITASVWGSFPIVGLSILIGTVTFSGSMVAFGKLSGKISGSAIIYTGQHFINALMFVGSIALVIVLCITPSMISLWIPIIVLALILGITFVIPIGGADMPVVISLLNSLSGIAASAAGFVINNELLIVAGALVGASGLILTNIMCKAMNRTLFDVLFKTFGQAPGAASATDGGAPKIVRETTADDLAVLLAYSEKVVIVPGYGLAVAQGQHAIKEVSNILEAKGVKVSYGIHPVAGRMPGHMNVLLAEADISYDLLFDMDEINPDMPTTDVVLVIGANDVVNPDALENSASPIYGMPIINVHEAKQTVVFKRSMNPGFAGIDNPLFYKENNQMFFGDAKKSLQNLVKALGEV
jgi:NAD(P) transhydrogenase subunit beta